MDELRNRLSHFKAYLIEEEKSAATVGKYLRDVGAFLRFVDGTFKKETVIAYKKELMSIYAPAR